MSKHKGISYAIKYTNKDYRNEVKESIRCIARSFARHIDTSNSRCYFMRDTPDIAQSKL